MRGNSMKNILLTGALFLGTGCSSYETAFTCSPGTGVGCKSASEIDQMIEVGEIGTQMRNSTGIFPETKFMENEIIRVFVPAYTDRENTLHTGIFRHLSLNEGL